MIQTSILPSHLLTSFLPKPDVCACGLTPFTPNVGNAFYSLSWLFPFVRAPCDKWHLLGSYPSPMTLMTVSGSSPFQWLFTYIYCGPGSLPGTSRLILAKNPWTRVTNIPRPSCGGEYKGSDRSGSQDCMSTISSTHSQAQGAQLPELSMHLYCWWWS